MCLQQCFLQKKQYDFCLSKASDAMQMCQYCSCCILQAVLQQKSILSHNTRYTQKPWVQVKVRSSVLDTLPKLLQFTNIVITSKVTERAIDWNIFFLTDSKLNNRKIQVLF